MTDPPQQQPPVSGPQAGEAKPAEPGPKDPPGIAASILPERQRDAARHPEGDTRQPEAARTADDVAAAAQQAVETRPQPQGED